jgi:hypothetical protein
VTEQQLADMITNDLTSANFEVAGVSCPCPNDTIEDSYCINIGKLHKWRNERNRINGKNERIFGFDVIGLDITIRNLTLISIVCSDNCYVRILLSADYRGWHSKELYGSNEEDVIMQIMLKIGYLKGFVAILSHQINHHRFSYIEEYFIDVTNMFINRNECDGLRNLLHADWIKLYEECTQIGTGKLPYIPIKIDIEHLRGLQRLSIDNQIERSVGLGHQECTAILLKFKNEVLGNNYDSGGEMIL